MPKLTRPRKARLLEKAGLRYVSGWLPQQQADEVLQQIHDADDLVKASLPPENK